MSLELRVQRRRPSDGEGPVRGEESTVGILSDRLSRMFFLLFYVTNNIFHFIFLSSFDRDCSEILQLAYKRSPVLYFYSYLGAKRYLQYIYNPVILQYAWTGCAYILPFFMRETPEYWNNHLIYLILICVTFFFSSSYQGDYLKVLRPSKKAETMELRNFPEEYLQQCIELWRRNMGYFSSLEWGLL